MNVHTITKELVSLSWAQGCAVRVLWLNALGGIQLTQHMRTHTTHVPTRNRLQELIWSGAELSSVLRLMVLASATQGGIPRKHWEGLRAEVVAAYGHQHLLTLHNLETAGEA